MSHYRSNTAACLAIALLALCAGAEARPPEQDQTKIPQGIELHGTPMLKKVCLRPFTRRGTFQLEPNYSGAGGGFTFDQPGFLQIRHLQAWLHVPGTTAGNLGATTNNAFHWYDMEMRNGKADYSAAQDGAVYADSNSWVKVVVYRNDHLDQRVSGEYVLEGCVVDRIPERVRKPDSQLPRLPPKLLTPLEPVEKTRLLKLQKIDPGR
jgi:hypothetical protein